MYRRVLLVLTSIFNSCFHRLHFIGHAGYFAAVFIDGHGLYAGAAAAMFFITLIGYFLNQE